MSTTCTIVFQICLFIFNFCFDISSLNLNLMGGGGMAAPLVVPGRNKSLNNKHTHFFFFNCGILSTLISSPHFCRHPTLVFATAASLGPHDNPTPGRAPSAASWPLPGPARHTCPASDGSTCPRPPPSQLPRAERGPLPARGPNPG